MKKQKNKGAVNRLKLLIFVFLFLLACVTKSVYSDWVQIFKNKQMTNELTSQYNNLVEEQTKLQSEVVKLQDPSYVARYAREKYLYSKDGEVIIKVTGDGIVE